MGTHRLIALIAAALVAVPVAGIPTGASAHRGSRPPHLAHTERAVVHKATKQVRDIDAALAAGYMPVGGCTELPGTGGMGYHYLNPVFAGDGIIDPDDGAIRRENVWMDTAVISDQLATSHRHPIPQHHKETP